MVWTDQYLSSSSSTDWLTDWLLVWSGMALPVRLPVCLSVCLVSACAAAVVPVMLVNVVPVSAVLLLACCQCILHCTAVSDRVTQLNGTASASASASAMSLWLHEWMNEWMPRWRALHCTAPLCVWSVIEMTWAWLAGCDVLIDVTTAYLTITESMPFQSLRVRDGSVKLTVVSKNIIMKWKFSFSL